MKIKFGSIVTDGSGKLGGHVYSKNRGGNYVRTNRVPSNPRTPAQILARSRFGQASAGWKGLSEIQRRAWAEFANTNPYSDSMGVQRHLSASSAYTRSSNNLLNVGKSPINVPVDVDEAIVFDAFSASFASPGTAEVELDNVDIANIGGAKLLVKASPPFPASQRYAANKLRVVGAFDGSDIDSQTDTLDFATEYLDKISGLTSNMRVAWEIHLIDSNGLSKFVAGGSEIVS